MLNVKGVLKKSLDVIITKYSYLALFVNRKWRANLHFGF